MSKTAIISNMLPDRTIERLSWLGKRVSDYCQEIGEITLLIIQVVETAQEQARHGQLKGWTAERIADLLETGRMDCYRYVVGVTGKSLKSITNYARTVQFYTADDWDEYDALPFSHFVKAMSYGIRAREFLDLSLRMFSENGGQFISVEWLESHFAAPANAAATQAALDVGAVLYDEPGDELPFSADPALPISAGAQYVLNKLSYALGALEKAAEKLQGEVQPSLYRRLRALLTDLGDTLREIAAEGEKERV